MFRPDLLSRRAMLVAMKGFALSGHPVGKSVSGPGLYCPDPTGRDLLLTPEEIAELTCTECKKHSILLARQLIDGGHCRCVELCMTVTADPEEHVFVRVDKSQFMDPAAAAGGWVRHVGDFIAETVWEAQPGV